MSSPRIAYILLWFPEPTQTFILDEVNTMAGLGLDLTVHTLYGPRPPQRLAGMAKVQAPVKHLGLASTRALLRSLARVKEDWGPEAPTFLRQAALRRWRSFETGGEAWWAARGGAPGWHFPGPGHKPHPRAGANGPATAAWVASRLIRHPLQFLRPRPRHLPAGRGVGGEAARGQLRAHHLPHQRALSGGPGPAAAAKLSTLPMAPPYRGTPGVPAPSPAESAPGPGAPGGKKGFPDLLAACRDPKEWGVDFHLTLAGDGPQRSHLAGLVREYARTTG